MQNPLINIVIPAYNEEGILAHNVQMMATFLAAHPEYSYEVVIANNGSTDRTLDIALRLRDVWPFVKVLNLDSKGRGRAVKHAWLQSDADVLVYMDADLSTDLRALIPLIQTLTFGEYDLATVSRLLNPTLTERSLKREIISRCYNLLIKMMFRTHFSDAQCGFKGMTQATAKQLLPLIEDDEWFMDTELLVVAEVLGFRLIEFPARWIENPVTKVQLWKTIWADLQGAVRLRRRLYVQTRRRPSAQPTLNW